MGSENFSSSGDGHFADRTPTRHILEKFSRGAAFASERHALEPAGITAGFVDSLRTTAASSALFALAHFSAAQPIGALPLALFAFGTTLWQMGRSSWLGWSRLERLHRELLAEKEEIATSRDQERIELEALYAMKGFSSPLLEQVVEVLMADDDRLLRVMLEEELGMSLAMHEHPLKQGLGAGGGALVAGGLFAGTVLIGGLWSALSVSALLVAGGSLLGAHLERNRILDAILWNLSLLVAILWIVHFAGNWALGG